MFANCVFAAAVARRFQASLTDRAIKGRLREGSLLRELLDAVGGRGSAAGDGG